jgi:hypothetical protein
MSFNFWAIVVDRREYEKQGLRFFEQNYFLKVKLSLQRAVETYTVVRRQGSHTL